MADAVNADGQTMSALEAKLSQDMATAQTQQSAFNAAQALLSSAQNDLSNYTGDPGNKDIITRFNLLHGAGKWGGKKVSSEKSMLGPVGDYYYVSPNDSQIWANTPGFQILQTQYNNYATALSNKQAAVTAAQNTLNAIQSTDGTTGTLPQANAAVTQDMANLKEFVPLTTAGQATTTQLANAQAQVSQAAAAQQKSAADATASQANIAASSTSTYIIVGIALLISLSIVIGYFKFKNKKA